MSQLSSHTAVAPLRWDCFDEDFEPASDADADLSQFGPRQRLVAGPVVVKGRSSRSSSQTSTTRSTSSAKSSMYANETIMPVPPVPNANVYRSGMDPNFAPIVVLDGTAESAASIADEEGDNDDEDSGDDSISHVPDLLLLFVVGLGANYLEDLFPPQLREVLDTNPFAKHLTAIMLILITVVWSQDSGASNGIIALHAFLVYAWFLAMFHLSGIQFITVLLLLLSVFIASHIRTTKETKCRAKSQAKRQAWEIERVHRLTRMPEAQALAGWSDSDLDTKMQHAFDDCYVRSDVAGARKMETLFTVAALGFTGLALIVETIKNTTGPTAASQRAANVPWSDYPRTRMFEHTKGSTSD